MSDWLICGLSFLNVTLIFCLYAFASDCYKKHRQLLQRAKETVNLGDRSLALDIVLNENRYLQNESFGSILHDLASFLIILGFFCLLTVSSNLPFYFVLLCLLSVSFILHLSLFRVRVEIREDTSRFFNETFKMTEQFSRRFENH